jgi:hypothetical protein
LIVNRICANATNVPSLPSAGTVCTTRNRADGSLNSVNLSNKPAKYNIHENVYFRTQTLNVE